MNDRILRSLAREVDPAVRVRANGYIDRVALVEDTPDYVTADVEGTEQYAVDLQNDGECLRVTCTCLYFSSENEVCKHIWATLLLLVRKRSDFGEAATHFDIENDPFVERESLAGPTKRSDWRDALRPVQALPQPLVQQRIDTPLLYAITRGFSEREVTINVLTRTLKADGTAGALRPVPPLRADEVALLPDPDRELAATFAAGFSPTRMQLRIPASAATFAMRRLAATGRLHLDLGSDGSLSEPLAYDEGPWSLQVTVSKGGALYEVTAAIISTGERIPVSEVRFVFERHGVTERRICAFADDEVMAWLVSFVRPIHVPETEIRDFLDIAAATGPNIHWRLPEDLQWVERRVAPTPVLALHPAEYGRTVPVDILFDYAGERFAWPPQKVTLRKGVKYVRQPGEEQRRVAEVTAAGIKQSYNRYELSQRQVVATVRSLVAKGWRVEAEGRPYRPPSNLRISVTSGIDWFDIEGDAMFDDVSVPLPQLLRAVKDGSGEVRLSDGSVGLIDDDWLARLAPLLRNRGKDPSLRFTHAQLPLLDVLLQSMPEVDFDDKVEGARKRLRTIRVAPLDPPPGFQGTLREYQREALGWMASLRDLGFGGCLADDMGLGKTVQVLAMLESRRNAKERAGRPTLIVVPRTLVFNWKAEAERFTPELRVLDLSGADRRELFARANEYDVLLTTYAMLRGDAVAFSSIALDYAILDEAQAIKNAEAATTKAVRLLNAKHRLALTGTPIENSVADLASIFDFTNPGMLSDSSTRVGPLVRAAGARGEDGDHARELIGKLARPFILRRTKAQVAPELPERIEKTIHCDLNADERKIYDELRNQYRASLAGAVQQRGLAQSKMHILEAMLRLRQASCHPRLVKPIAKVVRSTKFEVLMSELRDVIAEGHKALVFSQFTSLLALLRTEIEAADYRYEYLDGKTKDRQARVDRFQRDASIPLFLISLKAGGTGLNLTAAEYVFILDPWWNPAVEAQAIDRTHRIGQTSTVMAYRLVARDTIEEKILQLQASKRELADAIITEDNSLLRKLTQEDLDMLLS